MDLSDNEYTLFLGLLNAADAFAVDNVKLGHGGPFGASIHVYDPQSGKAAPVGGLAANAVLATGMGSAHAEDQAMSPANIAALKDYLRDHNQDGRLQVVMSSSAQSCPACHAKQEILARALVSEGLLRNGHFLVNFGATYEDTGNITGFNDGIYHTDMQRPASDRMIKSDVAGLGNIPQSVADIFIHSAVPVAVVAMPNGDLVRGHGNRAHDLMATADIMAIRNAARLQKEQGVDTPWNFNRAVIYSSGAGAGPLAYAESQWANIGTRIEVVHPRGNDWATQEAPGISNADLFRVVAAKKYNGADAAIVVRRLGPFPNKAQYEWRAKENKRTYNGAEPEQ